MAGGGGGLPIMLNTYTVIIIRSTIRLVMGGGFVYVDWKRSLQVAVLTPRPWTHVPVLLT